jgi:hypothetical protein
MAPLPGGPNGQESISSHGSNFSIDDVAAQARSGVFRLALGADDFTSCNS